MARCRHGHEPSTSNSVRRFYRENGPWQLTIRLRSESSRCSGEDDDGPCMVAEVRKRLRLTLTLPSPEQGRCYLLEPVGTLEGRLQLPIHGDPEQRFSSLDATLDTLAPLLGHQFPIRRLSLQLYEAVGRFAWAARIAGEQGPIRVLAGRRRVFPHAVEPPGGGRHRGWASRELRPQHESRIIDDARVLRGVPRGDPGRMAPLRPSLPLRLHLALAAAPQFLSPLFEDDDRSGFVFLA